MLTLDEIRAARERIGGLVRRTPIFDPAPILIPELAGMKIILKLESLQVTGSFKVRGALNKLKSLDPAALERGIVAASGGNHGVAVAYAGHVAQRPTRIFAPNSVGALKAQKIEDWGATLVRGGALFDDANVAATALAASEGLAYFHPFADAAIVAGQGTLGLEILEQIAEVDTILIAIGGGGLIAGVGTAVKALRPSVRIVGIEPIGAPTLKASIDAGRVVDLATVDTIVPTMAARRTEPYNFEIARRVVDDLILVSDDSMMAASRALWQQLGIAADLSGAASIAALMTGAYRPRSDETVCALICGAGNDGID